MYCLNKYVMGLLFWIAILIAGCSNKDAISDRAISMQDIQIEVSATVPVLDGRPTTTGVYIRNKSEHKISGIRYSVDNFSTTNKISLASQSCTEIAANSSCFLSFTTPSLSIGNSGSSLVKASYGDYISQQLISYHYVASKQYHGVNFSDNSIKIHGSNNFVTIYAFVGNRQSLSHVGFAVSTPSIAIMNGLTNGVVNFEANQVVALEVQSNTNITNSLSMITPYTVIGGHNFYKSLQAGVLENRQLQVIILQPTHQANLVMSSIPILTQSESTATIKIINNGTQSATGINFSSDSNDINIVNSDSQPCSSTLESGDSCNYKISLNNNYSNGSVNLSLNYNNGISQETMVAPAYFMNNNTIPSLLISATQSNFTEQINTNQNLIFSVSNLSNVALSNITVTPKSSLVYSTLKVQNSTCGTIIAANSSCAVQINVAAGDKIEKGYVLLNVTGSFTGSTTSNYSFISNSVTTTITDPVLPTVTSTTPQNSATGVSILTSVTVNFNESMMVTTLNNNNIFLQNVSTGSNVGLTLQGVSNNNQTVTFTQTTAPLIELTQYKIIINPSQILDSNGSPIDEHGSSQTVATFTTGDFTAPTITSFTPANGAINQSQTPAITLGFSESMAENTLTPSNIILQTQAGIVVSGYTISYNNNTKIATVNLNGTPLTSQTTYQLLVNQTKITDTSGNALGSNSNYLVTQFTTGDSIAPVLTSTVPLNGATNVAVGSSISLTFSESMNPGTLTNNTIHLQRNSTASNVSLTTGVISNNNQTVTFIPVNDLVGGESYSIIINPSTITDVAGNLVGSATTQVVSTFTSAAIAQKALLVGYNGQVLSFDSSNNSFTVLSEMKPNYLSVVSGDNGLVEVGENGRINYSINGTSWIRESSGTIYTINKVIWDGSQYIAVGGSFVLTSPDGQRWLVRDINYLYSPNTVNLVGIAYNSGGTYKYIAVGQYGQVIFSNDLLHWSQNDVLVSQNIAFYGIVAGDTSTGIFMTYSYGKIFYTYSPLSGWTEATIFSACPVGTNLAMTYNSSYGYFILTREGAKSCYSNTQGTNGTASTGSNMYSVSGGSYTYNIATGMGGTITSSTNYGIAWSSLISLPYNNNTLYGGAAVNGGGVFVVAGNNGINYWNSVNPTVAANWNSVVPSDPRFTIYSVTGNESAGSKTYIAVGGENNYGAIYKSTNVGVSWSNVIPAAVSTNIFKGITYANGMFVAVGQSGKIITSATGESGAWVVRTSPTTNNLNGITSCKNQLIAVGDSGTILTSTDGITWSILSGMGTTKFNGVACGTDKIVVVGNSGTIYYSTDGTTWTSATSGVTNHLTAVTYGNKHFVVTEATTGMALSGAYLTSADGITWTTRSITGSGYYWNYYAIQYVGGKFLAFGNLGNGNTVNYLSPTLGVVAISQDNSESTSWSMIDSYKSAALTTTYGGVAY